MDRFHVCPVLLYFSHPSLNSRLRTRTDRAMVATVTSRPTLMNWPKPTLTPCFAAPSTTMMLAAVSILLFEQRDGRRPEG